MNGLSFRQCLGIIYTSDSKKRQILFNIHFPLLYRHSTQRNPSTSSFCIVITLVLHVFYNSTGQQQSYVTASGAELQ
jgi:hypothetical protein